MDYPDPNAKNEEKFFNTPAEIEQGAFAIYSSFFHNNAFTWQLPEVFDGLANEFEGRPSSAGETEIQAVLRYEHTNSHAPIGNIGELLYRMICVPTWFLRRQRNMSRKTAMIKLFPVRSVMLIFCAAGLIASWLFTGVVYPENYLYCRRKWRFRRDSGYRYLGAGRSGF